MVPRWASSTSGPRPGARPALGSSGWAIGGNAIWLARPSLAAVCQPAARHRVSARSWRPVCETGLMASHEQGGHLTRAWRHLERPVRILVYLLIALAVAMLYHQTEFLVGHLFNVLLLFVFAAIIALLLTPVIDRVEMLTIFKGRRAIAVLLLYVVIIGLVAGLIALVAPALIGQAQQLPDLGTRAIAFVKSLQDAIDRAGISLHPTLPRGTRRAAPRPPRGGSRVS